MFLLRLWSALTLEMQQESTSSTCGKRETQEMREINVCSLTKASKALCPDKLTPMIWATRIAKAEGVTEGVELRRTDSNRVSLTILHFFLLCLLPLVI
jgi:hypothetical protein